MNTADFSWKEDIWFLETLQKKEYVLSQKLQKESLVKNDSLINSNDICKKDFLHSHHRYGPTSVMIEGYQSAVSRVM